MACTWSDHMHTFIQLYCLSWGGRGAGPSLYLEYHSWLLCWGCFHVIAGWPASRWNQAQYLIIFIKFLDFFFIHFNLFLNLNVWAYCFQIRIYRVFQRIFFFFFEKIYKSFFSSRAGKYPIRWCWAWFQRDAGHPAITWKQPQHRSHEWYSSYRLGPAPRPPSWKRQ